MIKITNTLSGKKEVFKPLKDKQVNMFVCGPTVFDMAHLGHARTYIIFDVIVKYLRSRGYDVFYLQNITDVDDKIIKRAAEEKVSWQKIASKYEKLFYQSMRALKVTAVSQYARATDYIPEIISQVEKLLDKGYAYFLEDGIYYDISKFKDYGKLAKRTRKQAEDGVSRIDDAIGKRNKGDFCLWKKSKPGEPRWNSPWFFGRPGWHIEDTAIAEKYFGPQYDIHGGGRDLIFPHHEAEIAQMEAISGKKPFVKYWLHTGFLTINKEKMSKSLKNFTSVDAFLKDTEDGARVLRLMIIKNHYRSPIEFNEKIVEQAKREIRSFDEFIERLKIVEDKKQKNHLKIEQFQKAFEQAMDDDFNTPKALGVIFTLIKQANILINKNELSKDDIKNMMTFLGDVDKSFGFIFRKRKRKYIPLTVEALLKEREQYRQANNFDKADELRAEIKKLGYTVDDTPHGPVVKKIK